MNKLSKILGLFGLGVFMIALNLGSFAGCESSGTGGGGTGGVNDNVTTARLTASLATIGGFCDQGDGAALIAYSEQVGLKAQSGECTGDFATEFTCPCAGGGSSTTTHTDAGIDVEFSNCIDEEGNLLDGLISLTEESDGSCTIDYDNLTTDFGDCGTFTLNGTLTTIDNTIAVDVTATGGGETINIDGDLTAETDETTSGTVSFNGSVENDCFFDHTDISICPETAEACGLPVDEVCDGNNYTDLCE